MTIKQNIYLSPINNLSYLDHFIFYLKLIVFVVSSITLIFAVLLCGKLIPFFAKWLPVIFHKLLIWLLSIQIDLEGEIDTSNNSNLYISNHLSYLDIPILGSTFPMRFVAKSVNPKVDIDVIWVNTWYDPPKEANAAKVMIAEGCDMVAQHTDSPSPIQVAEKSGVFGFGQASDQYRFAPKAQLTATIDNWSPYYISKVQSVIDGNWKSMDYFGHMNEDVVQMAPFTNMPADVKAKAEKIKNDIRDGKYFAFTGPLKDNKGVLQLKDGEVASDAHLNSMMYYVEGIDAKVPGGK